MLNRRKSTRRGGQGPEPSFCLQSDQRPARQLLVEMLGYPYQHAASGIWPNKPQTLCRGSRHSSTSVNAFDAMLGGIEQGRLQAKQVTGEQKAHDLPAAVGQQLEAGCPARRTA
jgi:hypothetical protein